jgi:hypothetical protein
MPLRIDHLADVCHPRHPENGAQAENVDVVLCTGRKSQSGAENINQSLDS